VAIVGLGTDIVEIKRIQAALTRTGDKFALRVLSESEWTEYINHKQPHRFLAKRFSVKEAAAKALGTGISQGVTFHDFSITHDHLGKPLLSLSGMALSLSENMNILSYHISISDEQHYSVATVIFES